MAKPLNPSNPTGTMGKIKFPLSPTLVGTDFKDADKERGEHRFLPPGKRGKYKDKLAGVPLYSVRGSHIIQFLKQPLENRAGRIEFFDVRGGDAWEIARMKAPNGSFPNANYMPTKTSTPDYDPILDNWAKNNPGRWHNMLTADYVVIFCVQGKQRSPEVVLAYAAAWHQAVNKNSNQKICLLNGGFFEGFWQGKGDDPATFAWSQTVRDRLLAQAPANLVAAV